MKLENKLVLYWDGEKIADLDGGHADGQRSVTMPRFGVTTPTRKRRRRRRAARYLKKKLEKFVGRKFSDELKQEVFDEILAHSLKLGKLLYS